MSNRQFPCGHAAQLKEFNSVDKVKSCQLAWEPKPALCYCLIYERRCCPQLLAALTVLTSSHAIHHLLSPTWNTEKLSHSLRITVPYCTTLLSPTWSYAKTQLYLKKQSLQMVVTNPFPVPPFPIEVANILQRCCCFVCYHVLGASILLNFNLFCTHGGRFAGLWFKGVTAQTDIEPGTTDYGLQRALSSH